MYCLALEKAHLIRLCCAHVSIEWQMSPVMRGRSLAVTVALLAIGSPCAASAHEDFTVALDFSSIDEQTYRSLDVLSLERELVVRLVQEGFAVVAASARPRPSLVLRYLATPPGLRLEPLR